MGTKSSKVDIKGLLGGARLVMQHYSSFLHRTYSGGEPQNGISLAAHSLSGVGPGGAECRLSSQFSCQRWRRLPLLAFLMGAMLRCSRGLAPVLSVALRHQRRLDESCLDAL